MVPKKGNSHNCSHKDNLEKVKGTYKGRIYSHKSDHKNNFTEDYLRKFVFSLCGI